MALRFRRRRQELGVEPKQVSSPATKEWLEKHFRVGLDAMEAASVQEKGWSEDQVLQLEGKLKKCNEVMGLEIELKPFTQKTKTPDKQTIDTTCIVDGKLYLNKLETEMLDFTEILLYHEAGHEVERVRGKFENSEELQTLRNRMENPGIMSMPFSQDKAGVLIPPSNIPSWHRQQVTEVLTGLDDDVGYNFRQINCDTMAFQKRQQTGTNQEELVKQYLKYLGYWSKALEEKRKDILPQTAVNMIPTIARLTAGAMAMSIYAREILHNTELSQEAQQFIGKYVGGRLKGATQEEITEGSFEHQLDQTLQFNEEQKRKYKLAYAITTQAYKEYFISSLGMRELFKKERQDTHTERLKEGQDPQTIKNELILLGHMKDERFTQPITECLTRDNKDTRLCAAWALGNIQDPQSIDALTQTITADEDDEVRAMGNMALAEIGYKHPKQVVNALAEKANTGNMNQKVRAAWTIEMISDKKKEDVLQALEENTSFKNTNMGRKVIQSIKGEKEVKEHEKVEVPDGVNSILLTPTELEKYFPETEDEIMYDIEKDAEGKETKKIVNGLRPELFDKWVKYLKHEDNKVKGAALARLIAYANVTQMETLKNQPNHSFAVRMGINGFLEGTTEFAAQLGTILKTKDSTPEVEKSVQNHFMKEGADSLTGGLARMLGVLLNPDANHQKILRIESRWQQALPHIDFIEGKRKSPTEE